MSNKRNKAKNATVDVSSVLTPAAPAVQAPSPVIEPVAPVQAPAVFAAPVRYSAADIVKATAASSKVRLYKSGAIGHSRWGRKQWLIDNHMDNTAENRMKFQDYIDKYGKDANVASAGVIASGEVAVYRTTFNDENGRGAIFFQRITDMNRQRDSSAVTRRLTGTEAKGLQALKDFQAGKISLVDLTAIIGPPKPAAPVQIPNGPNVGPVQVQNIGLTPSLTAPVTA